MELNAHLDVVHSVPLASMFSVAVVMKTFSLAIPTEVHSLDKIRGGLGGITKYIDLAPIRESKGKQEETGHEHLHMGCVCHKNQCLYYCVFAMPSTCARPS